MTISILGINIGKIAAVLPAHGTPAPVGKHREKWRLNPEEA
ncbi:hypothetical protein [Rhizobium sp. TRM95796]|nr:hypothetical protein [Rhizobium sp. TRM95796]MCV3768984.1 hypothetical protein [Rhizobium sp. TRM95796]